MSRLQLLLIGFLLLAAGFAGGWVTHRSMVVDRMHDVARMRKAGGFEDFLYRRIQATPEQQKTLDPIVQRYGVRIDSMHHRFGSDRRAVIEQMHEEIKPLLTEEQVEKLNRFSRRFEMRDGHPKKRRQWD
ncbi:hypothetical protein [Phaeodactylibacter sp.]|uniref:hypothetical protein n=1 Tax=Phaeodactylibacter sp. TaxID=1940289 RepID=UPI0025FC6FE2|nr:hypothetical protein [Phaeodactylibacter sp.]MCI4649045.1 hypothetical protein [Phaeodactylibacter sp.]MCI5091850.1 hypothetical protein [Phaeodactylibacter sp.]